MKSNYPFVVLSLLMAFILVLVSSTLSVRAEDLTEDDISLLMVSVEDAKTHEQLPNATVYIDNALVGNTSYGGTIVIITTIGSHTLKVIKDGYETRETNVEVAPYDTSITVQLNPIKIKPVEVSVYILYLSIILIVGAIVGYFAYNYYKYHKGVKLK